MSVGALGLLPENASHQIRLEAIGHVVASLPESSSKYAPTPHRLRSLLNNSPFSGQPIGTAEDPCDNAFTEEVTFYGGSFLVIPGRGEETTFLLRTLSTALFQHQDRIHHAEFMTAARAVIAAALVLSDGMAKKAKLTRGLSPASTGKLFVPDAERLETLKNAVRFSEDELDHLFHSAGHNLAGLAPLVCPPGSALDSYRIDAGQLLTHPLVMDARETIIVVPGGLAAAAVNAVLTFAQIFEVVPDVAERFTDVIWHSVGESLRRIDGVPLRVEMPPPPDLPCFRDGLFHLDADKVTYSLLLCDPLEGYDPEIFAQHWELHDLQEKIAHRVREVAEFIFSWPKPPMEMFCLIVLQSLGRSFLLGVNESLGLEWGEMMFVTAADLDTLTQLEDNEPLKLWKFARAHRKVAQRSKLISTGVLNEYAVYKDRSHGYYVSDEERPTLMVFPPGSAGELRRDVVKRIDLHGVTSYEDAGAVVDVGTLFGPEIPIYAELRNLGRLPALLVEAYDIPVWVIGTPGKRQSNLRYADNAVFVDSIAYWLWQIAPSMQTVISTSALAEAIVFHVELVEHESWQRSNVPVPDLGNHPVHVSAVTADGFVRIIIQPQIIELLKAGDNAGERLIVEAILRGLRDLGPDAARLMTDEMIAAMIERHAPLGPKKRIFILNSQNAPLQNAQGLPDYRSIQEADEQEVLDDLGDMLIAGHNYQVGEIHRSNQNEITKRAVGSLYTELERLVATLRPDGLLEWLVSHYESCLAKKDYFEMNLPARIACFSSRSKVLKDFIEEASLQAATATAARFIVEYVTARPPKGFRPVSLSIHDRLQALASHIIQLGFVSDMIQYELSDIEIRVLPSRRVAFSKDKFDAAIQFYQAASAPGQLEHLEEQFPKRFKSPSEEGQSGLLEQLSAALAVEFGFSFDELTDFHHEAVRIGWERSESGVTSLSVANFWETMAERLTWPIDRVKCCLDRLSLQPRSNFLAPPRPFTKEDVYPWRFNRPLSYLRRPFLRRQGENEEQVVWGSRIMFSSLEFFAHLCATGRLKAQSLPLKQVLSRINNRRGSNFNREVAAFLRGHAHLQVKENVKKLPGLLGLRELGEIDVLGADVRRKALFVLECKDLAIARNPHEFALELDNLFVGVQDKLSIIARLTLKSKWIELHLREVLTWMQVPNVDGWRCEPLVVVDREMVTPRLRQSQIRVLSLKKLKEMF